MRGCGENAVYLIFVDEIPGLFFPPNTGPSREAREVLAIAVEYFKEAGLVAVPIWRMAHDAGASLAGAARRLGVEAVLLGTSQRGAVWHLLRGNVLRSLVRELPETHARLDRQLGSARAAQRRDLDAFLMSVTRVLTPS